MAEDGGGWRGGVRQGWGRGAGLCIYLGGGGGGIRGGQGGVGGGGAGGVCWVVS